MEKLFIFEKKPDQRLQKDSIKEIELQYVHRKEKRESEFEKRKKEIEDEISGRQRKSQNIVLYFMNLLILVTVSLLNAFELLQPTVNPELKPVLIIVFVFLGLVFSLIANLMIAPWKEVLKLYLMLDSSIPVVIAATIGFFTVNNFAKTSQWSQHVYAVAFPFWVAYLGGSMRVNLVYVKWAKWEVIIFKLVVLFSGLIFFYIGFQYMMGKYKFAHGFLPSVESRFKDMIYLYVFGIVELFFEYYRRLSSFDQTEELKSEYQFQDQSEGEKKRMAKAEVKMMELQLLKENLKDELSRNNQRSSIVSSSNGSNSLIPGDKK